MNNENIQEARLVKTNNFLLVFGKVEDEVVDSFFGTVITIDPTSPPPFPNFSQKTVYLCGDLSEASTHEKDFSLAQRLFVVKDLSQGGDFLKDHAIFVGVGRVPLDVHGVGVLYRKYFETGFDYFNQIRSDHTFQSLTESTKAGTAHREGIYLTPVRKEGDDLHFRLLRCSTNLKGPTDNFRATDEHIVDAMNQEADSLFEDHAPLNHVLAQIYWNNPASNGQKETKAKIKAHSDKTKDMPWGGIMAFCTFYNDLHNKLHQMNDNPFDYAFKTIHGKIITSGLTKLVFRLKPCVRDRPNCPYTHNFSVLLSPESVFFMPLTTNRIYTHEIRPSGLTAEKLPTRLGYVVRCSDSKAIQREGKTYFNRGEGKLVEMEEPTQEGMDELRKLYAIENRVDELVTYAQKFPFSMNKGDYTPPIYHPRDEFRHYQLPNLPNNPLSESPFEQLKNDVFFEKVLKGRQGTVLLSPHPTRGLPIVRTTTKYTTPAQPFHSPHHQLARRIEQACSLPFRLNNALIEIYTNEYKSMGMHSDQAQDLEEGSHVAVFSCYKDPEVAAKTEKPPRKLVVEPKGGGEGGFEVPMGHNSVIVFSLDTNRRFTHKIVLAQEEKPEENEWLGVTFRTSGTYVKPMVGEGEGEEGRALFEDGGELKVASKEEAKELYKMRGRENREVDFVYPKLSVTLSPSDLMPLMEGKEEGEKMEE